MLCALLTVALLFQDPADTLRDPLKRAKEADRKAALEYFKAKEFDGPFFWVATRFLEKGDAAWKLRVDGAVDPAAPGLDIYLVRYGRADLSESDHRAALDTLVAIVEKTKATSQAHDAVRLFGLAHAGAVSGDVPAAAKLGLVRAGDRWGTADQHAHYAMARSMEQPDKVDPSMEAAARGSASFGARYAALLLQIHRTLATRRGHESTFLAIAGWSSGGGPKGAAEHVKALAASFKAAAYCKDCKNGRVTCAGCQGKKRVDIKCPECGGEGRVGSAGDTGVGATQRCNPCGGTGTLKDQACAPCSKSGLVECGKCSGSPWFDRACSNLACKGGKAPCADCKGRQRIDVQCKDCGGAGRKKALGDAGAGATHQCRTCKGRGSLKDAAPCATCANSPEGKGVQKCGVCGGTGRESRAPIVTSDVYSADRCAACRASGWPLAGLAVPCTKCCGLGTVVKPAADPAKVLD